MSYYVTNDNSFLDIKNAHLRVTGNVHTDVMKLGAVEFAPPQSTVPGTVNFTNVTTGVTTSSNLSVGGTLSLGTVEVVATTHTLANTTAVGNVTPHTIQFSNVTTGIVTTANVEVGGELTVTGNVAVDTDTLKIDSTNNRVGIGTNTPSNSLHVYKASDDQISGLFIEKANGASGTAQITFGVASNSNEAANEGVAKAGIFFQRTATKGRGDLKFCVDNVDNTNVVVVADAKLVNRSDGNVGIGTQSPDEKLEIVEGSSIKLSGDYNHSTAKLYIDRVDGATWGTSTLYDAFRFFETRNTSGSEHFNAVKIGAGGIAIGYDPPLYTRGGVDSLICSGNVGIGTTSPGQKLSIYTGSTTVAGLSIDRYSTGNYRTEFYQADTGLAIHVGNASDAPTEKMRIHHNGNVGIGESSPKAKLHIKSSSGGDGIAIFHPSGGTGGTLNLSGGVRGGILISNGGGGSDSSDDYSSQPIVLTGGGTTATNGNIRGGSIWSMWGGSQYGLAFKGASDGESVPAGGTTPNLFVSKDKVGIGTKSPGAKLDIKGDIKISGSTSGGYTLSTAATGGILNFTHGSYSWGRWNNAHHYDVYSGDNYTGSRDLYLNYYTGAAVRLTGGTAVSSDDRIKTNERYITNATETLLKLKPQIYDKGPSLGGGTGGTRVESGLIVQDIYYDAPELRHLVHYDEDAEIPDEKPYVDDDPQKDPDYSMWGTKSAGLNYEGFIAYLIKSNQELHARIQALENTS